MTAYIGAVFYATMVISALIMDVVFNALGWIPASRPDVHAEVVQFSGNYTFWLNIVFGVLTVGLLMIARRHPMQHGRCEHHGHQGGCAFPLSTRVLSAVLKPPARRSAS
jgi:uncharacterized protein